MSEWEIINKLKSLKSYQLIGDDCAILDNPFSHGETSQSFDKLLVSSDMLLSGVHFHPPKNIKDYYLIGRKSLAVSLSDIAAMGGNPLSVSVSIAVSRQIEDYSLDKNKACLSIMSGIQDLAKSYNISISGGDTTFWDNPLAINTTILGKTLNGRVGERSNAKVGHKILVTGPLGGSLESGKHLSFEPRVLEGQYLVSKRFDGALIDLSDGLATDLRQVLDASQQKIKQPLGAVLWPDKIPCNKEVKGDWIRAISDGEDFELCFTACSDFAEELLLSQPFENCKLFEIGEIIDQTGLYSEALTPSGGRSSRRLLTHTGYEHK